MIDFVVTGCGRSGTQYTACLWTRLGLLCGHELVFNAVAICNNEVPTFSEVSAYSGDSSWIAAGMLEHQHEALDGIKIFHQIRNPVHVIRSMMGIKSFERSGAYTRYIRKTLADYIQDNDDPLICCMKFWFHWNILTGNLCAFYPTQQYKVEALTASKLCKYSTWATGRAISEEECAEVLETASKLTNSRKRDESVTWESLPEGMVKAEIAGLALSYGYTVEELYQA